MTCISGWDKEALIQRPKSCSLCSQQLKKSIWSDLPGCLIENYERISWQGDLCSVRGHTMGSLQAVEKLILTG
jgi:hypothetical protein